MRAWKPPPGPTSTSSTPTPAGARITAVRRVLVPLHGSTGPPPDRAPVARRRAAPGRGAVPACRRSLRGSAPIASTWSSMSEPGRRVRWRSSTPRPRNVWSIEFATPEGRPWWPTLFWAWFEQHPVAEVKVVETCRPQADGRSSHRPRIDARSIAHGEPEPSLLARRRPASAGIGAHRRQHGRMLHHQPALAHVPGRRTTGPAARSRSRSARRRSSLPACGSTRVGELATTQSMDSRPPARSDRRTLGRTRRI